MDNDKTDGKHQDSSSSIYAPQMDFARAAQQYMAIDSRNFIDETEDHQFIVHSPQNFIPKFLQDLDIKTNGIYCQTPDNSYKERSVQGQSPLYIKFQSDTSINDKNIMFHQPRRYHSDMAQSSSQMMEYSKTQPGSSTNQTKEMQDDKGNNSEDEDNGRSDGNIIDNYAAALVARVKVKGAFNNAAENRVFDASNQELILINDKAYIVDYKGIDKRQRVLRSQRRKGPRLRLILQKHGILSENLGKKKKPTSKNNKKKTTISSLRVKLNSFRETTKTCCSKLTECLFHAKDDFCDLISNWCINPHGRFKICWDFLSMIFIFYDLVNVPFVICFDVPSNPTIFIFDALKDVFFMIDVCLNFKTGYIDDGYLITDSTLIRKRYLKSWFLVDLLTSLPISLFVDLAFDNEFEGSSVRAFRLLKFLRFVRLARVFKAIRLKKLFVRMEEFVYSSIFNGIKGLIGLFFMIILVAHWVACIWHFVGSVVQDSTGDSWMIHYDIAEADDSDRYIASMYWAIATMLTVGYGDILPVSTAERALNIVVMLIGCAVFAYSMNSIGILVQNIQAGVSRTRLMYYNLSKYMDQKRVSKNIRSKVIHYLDYMIETQKHGKMVEDQLFSILSDNIRAELKKDINGQVLRENALLQKNFGNKFLSILSNSLEEKIFSPGEVIFDEMDKTCHMYFIATGTVDLYYSDCNVILKKLERECHFGEIAFFTGKERTAAARSSTFSDIFFIRRHTFLTVVEEYTGDKEMFHLIKDNISLYNSFEALKLKCLLCGNEGHVARNCHRVHYVPDKDKIISKYHADDASFNKNFKRERTRNQFRSRTHLKEIGNRAMDYCKAHPGQIEKHLNNTFGTAFFNIVNKLKNKTEEDPDPESDVTVSSCDKLDDIDPEKQVTFAENLSPEASPSNKSRTSGSITDRKGRNSQSKIVGRRKKLRQFLNPRFRMKHAEKKEKDHSEKTASMKRLSIEKTEKEQRVTIIKMANGIDLTNQKVVFEVVDSNNQNNGAIKPNPVPPINDETPLEIVANFSIYFPHNNITKILNDLKDLKQGKKDSIERRETRMKKLKSSEFKNKAKERKSFFFNMTPTSKKSKWLNSSNSKEFSFRNKETLLARTETQAPAAGTATNAIFKLED